MEAVEGRRKGRLELLYEERAQRDREKLPAQGYYFDEEEADRVVEFIEGYCSHHKGEWAGKPLLLEDWQKDILREAFGWYRPDGTRRYRVVYIEIARKNGKTQIVGAVGLYLLVADDEPGAEIYTAATKKEQARIAFDAARAMVKKSSALLERVKPLRLNLSVERTDSKMEPVSADGKTLDGLNPHGALIDELHAHKDRLVWDVLQTGMGARRQPMTFEITTAGTYDPTTIGWEQHEYAVRVLEQAIEDESFFAYIAAMDEGDDWEDPLNWEKANPNLGTSVKYEYLKQEAKRAKNSPSYLNTFLRLHMNRWTQQVTRWIPIEKWHACGEIMVPDEYRGRKAFGGLDLSSKLDVTAFLLCLPPTEEDPFFRFLPTMWVPEDTVQRRSELERVPYNEWARDAYIRTTPGNVIDYDFIEAEIRRSADFFDLEEVAYDPWNATQTGVRLGNAGITMVEMRQGYASLSEPAKDFEALVVSGKIRHPKNKALDWMVGNVAITQDPAGNIKPAKDKSTEKIDGVIAATMALGRAVIYDRARSVYEDRGMLVL